MREKRNKRVDIEGSENRRCIRCVCPSTLLPEPSFGRAKGTREAGKQQAVLSKIVHGREQLALVILTQQLNPGAQ